MGTGGNWLAETFYHRFGYIADQWQGSGQETIYTMNKFLSPSPLWQTAGLTLIRLTVGYFMIYHGAEIFSEDKMNGYLKWDLFKNTLSGKTMVYIGKGAEFIGGLLLFIGLLTRVAVLILAGTMAYITFFVGHGKIWYEDQHPFLFVLLVLVFFFTGPGTLSIDSYLFRKK